VTRGVRLTVLMALAVVSLGMAGDGRGVRSFVIQGDYKIGGYAVKTDGTLAGAVEEFGEPTARRRSGRGSACDVAWRPLVTRSRRSLLRWRSGRWTYSPWPKTGTQNAMTRPCRTSAVSRG
jgi:hypothetical protein